MKTNGRSFHFHYLCTHKMCLLQARTTQSFQQCYGKINNQASLFNMLKQKVKIRKTLLRKTVKCQQQCRCVISKWINHQKLLTAASLRFQKQNKNTIHFRTFQWSLRIMLRSAFKKKKSLSSVLLVFSTKLHTIQSKYA